MKAPVFVLFAFLSALSVYAAEEEITDHEKAARDFSFEKTKLGTSLAEFKKRHPKAEAIEGLSDKKFGVVGYTQQSQAGPECAYHFFEGKLFIIKVAYTEIADFSALSERLVEKYGKAHIVEADQKSSKVKTVWVFSKVDRLILLERTDILAGLSVYDTKILDKLTEKKKKSLKTGIDD